VSGAAGRTAWGVWVLTALAMALTLFLVSLNARSSSFWSTGPVTLLILAFSSVGALVASRRPGNSIGWLFLGGAFVWIAGELALEYAVYSLVTSPGTLPAGQWAAWFGASARGVGWFLIVILLLLLFPNGRLPSPRWRPVLWGALVYIAFFALAVWLSPRSFDLRLAPYESNPLGLGSANMALLLDIAYLTFPLLIVASGAAVIVRFRRSRGDERLQIKWFAYAVALMVVVFLIWFSFAVMGFAAGSALMFTVPLVGLPVAVGVAILRHRLYDIDLVINRTLVYAALTALLAATYVICVVALQQVFRVLTGGESQLAVVASTLAIAALFGPLRRRVQTFIDRRFYRTKYDARRTLEAFSARLRDETDVGELSNDMLGVVHETVRPEHASLWLRPAVGPDRDAAAEQSR
jgi:hypothetical protein